MRTPKTKRRAGACGNMILIGLRACRTVHGSKICNSTKDARCTSGRCRKQFLVQRKLRNSEFSRASHLLKYTAVRNLWVPSTFMTRAPPYNKREGPYLSPRKTIICRSGRESLGRSSYLSWCHSTVGQSHATRRNSTNHIPKRHDPAPIQNGCLRLGVHMCRSCLPKNTRIVLATLRCKGVLLLTTFS